MYQGASKLTLDEKGRIAMPARHRDELLLVCDGRMTITRHPDGCLLVYPRPQWENKRNELDAVIRAKALAFSRHAMQSRSSACALWR